MNGQENSAGLLVMCVVMIVLSILGIIAGFSRELLGSLDGLLLLFISLMMILIFGLLLFIQAKHQGWIGKRQKEESPANSSGAAGSVATIRP